MALEIELKFLWADLAAIRKRLVAAGGRCHGWTFERNIVFDTPDRSLRARSMLLRLRRADRTSLTLKRKFAGAASEVVKTLEEIETEVGDADAMRGVLAALGYIQAFCYEKVRATWRLDQATVCLDRLPFGDFVEIESCATGESGDAVNELAAVAAQLGLDMAAATSKTYHELHRDYRARHGLPQEENFVFTGPIPNGVDLCNQ